MRLRKSTISAIIVLVGLATIVVMSGLNFLIPQNIQTDVDDYSDTGGYKNMNKFFFSTKDNIKIAADLYEIENPVGWLVLVHMMPATRESWQDLAEEFTNQGYESIAIDLRGHGESDKGPDGYSVFSDEQHQESILDLEAAVDYLIQNRGATADKICFIGASIGANLSLQYVSEHPESKAAVLLSAGLNYRGIKTEPFIKKFRAGQKIFLVSSLDDGENTEENQKLYESVPAGAKKEMKIYETAGHGTTMLQKESGLKNLILEFLKVK